MVEYRRRNLLLMSISTAILAAAGIVYINSLHPSASAQPQLDPSVPVDRSIKSGGPKTPDEFLQEGGKSVIAITPASDVIDAARGSVVKATLTLQHIPGANPLPSVTVVANGIGNGIIPPSVEKSTTPEERASTLSTTGKPVAGAIELNSLVTFSPTAVTLKPGESQQIDMYITIPKDWPDELVGTNVWFSVIFGEGESYDYRDLLIDQTGINVHVVS
jgi:hypothetical protein